MLFEPGMIGRTLNREVERDLHLQTLACRNEITEIRQRAQFRMHRIVAALGGADGIGTSGIVVGGRDRIVAALSVGVTDGVDRGEIDHVESHRRDIRQARDAILEGAVLVRYATLAARHHLVPGTGPRQRPIRDQRKQRRPRQVGPKLALGHGVLQFGRQQRRGVAGLKIFFALLQDDGGCGRSSGLRLGEQARALDRVEGKVGAGFLFELESVPPGRKFIGPCLDRIDIASGCVRDERTAPAVVAVADHRLATPLPILLAAPDQRGSRHIMAVAIDVCPDFDTLPDDTLHGKAAAVDQRIDVFDMESAARSALDSLSCFVHGDAIDMEKTSRFILREKRRSRPIYQTAHRVLVPRERHDAVELNTAILFLHLENLATSLAVACKPRAEWTFTPKLNTSESRPNLSTVTVTAM